MISTDITGSNGGDASQVFNLLSIISDPVTYNEKLKKLVDATEEYKKYTALVGPASEIIALREKIAVEKEASTQALEDAKSRSERMISDATAEAVSITRLAKIDAMQLSKETSEIKAANKLVLEKSEQINANLKNKLIEIEVDKKTLEDKVAELTVEIKKAQSEKIKFTQMQKSLSDKIALFTKDLLA